MRRGELFRIADFLETEDILESGRNPEVVLI